MGEKGTAIAHGGREYTVYGARAGARLYPLFLWTTPISRRFSKEYREKRPVVCLAAFDNREELVRDSMGGEESRIVGESGHRMRNWVVVSWTVLSTACPSGATSSDG